MRDSMSLVCGASGVSQGLTGNHIARMLLERGFPVRAFVHKDDESCDKLRVLGARIVEGDLLDLQSVRSAMGSVQRAYFAYPVQEGLLDATAVFAAAARDAVIERVVNLWQLLTEPGEQPTPCAAGVLNENLVARFAAENVQKALQNPHTKLSISPEKL